MEKTVIIINGNGGVGKDTLCDSVRQVCEVMNVSAITPIKRIAQKYGWNGEKDEKSRKFLADLKKAFIDYNDLPTKYLIEQYNIFLNSKAKILFVHIREGEEIDKFKCYVKIPCYTLLIRRDLIECKQWGNYSDDGVANYSYDFYYDNNKPLKQTEIEFPKYIKKILKEIDSE